MIRVHVLPVKFSFNDKEDVLYPVILENDTQMILVDCGYAGFMPLIEQAAHHAGLSLKDLTGMIITHHDIDHMGGLAEIKTKYPHVKVCSSATEEKYISGKEKSLRLVQAETMYDSLPEEHKPGALYFQQMLRNMQPVEVDYILPDNGPLLLMEGTQVIATPGHMPGHLSLYLKESRTLIAADAVVYEGGQLEIANPHFTLDLPQAVNSVTKLLNLEIDTLICYHGGVVKDYIQPLLRQLLGEYTHLQAV
jgi:glyoxylase-like metal-dependent hydrolase (beta-lactamase superfamily II)